MFYSVNLLYFIVPAVLVQYGLAIYSIMRVLFLDLPKKQFFFWNFFILLVIGIGVITFFICYYGFRQKVFKDAAIYKKSEDTLNSDNNSNQRNENDLP